MIPAIVVISRINGLDGILGIKAISHSNDISNWLEVVFHAFVNFVLRELASSLNFNVFLIKFLCSGHVFYRSFLQVFGSANQDDIANFMPIAQSASLLEVNFLLSIVIAIITRSFIIFNQLIEVIGETAVNIFAALFGLEIV